MPDAIMKDCKDRMDKALAALEQHFETLRTGRASLGILDGVTVAIQGAGGVGRGRRSPSD